MSYESVLNLIDVCNDAKGRYQGYYNSSVTMLKNNFSSWCDNVGTEANKSLSTIADVWYGVVTEGFGNAYNGANSIKCAYLKLKSVKQNVEQAVTQINSAMAGIK